jgi:hypothetical protein
MTAPRDPDRLIRLFLDEGQAELPDRAYDTVRSEIDHTRQRVVIGPWRNPYMPIFARLAIGAAAVLLVAVVGINLMPETGQTGGAVRTERPSEKPSPAASKAAPAFVDTTIASDGGTGTMKANVTIPADWEDFGWSVTQCFSDDCPDDQEGVGVSIWTVGNLYLDACDITKGEAGKFSPPVGPTVDDLVAAFVAQPTLETTTPRPVTFAGYSGMYLEVTVPDTCTADEIVLMIDADGGLRAPDAGEVDRLWILDVNGRRAVIDASRQRNARAMPLAQQEYVLSTLEFTR